MKIQTSNLPPSAMKAYQKPGIKSDASETRRQAPQGDALELSGAAKALKAMVQDGISESEISQKAQEIKAKLRAGTYQPDLEKLAETLTEQLLQERKSRG